MKSSIGVLWKRRLFLKMKLKLRKSSTEIYYSCSWTPLDIRDNASANLVVREMKPLKVKRGHKHVQILIIRWIAPPIVPLKYHFACICSLQPPMTLHLELALGTVTTLYSAKYHPKSSTNPPDECPCLYYHNPLFRFSVPPQLLSQCSITFAPDVRMNNKHCDSGTL